MQARSAAEGASFGRGPSRSLSVERLTDPVLPPGIRIEAVPEHAGRRKRAEQRFSLFRCRLRPDLEHGVLTRTGHGITLKGEDDLADTECRLRRALVITAFLLALALAPSALAAKPSWAQNDIETVVAAGLMAPSVAEFRPDDALTAGELAELTAMLGGTVGVAAEPARPVQLKELDAVLVRLLKVASAAKRVRAALATAGLKPPAYAGTEIVARLLGLRLNHPEALDAIELGPRDPITRAETAYSVARALELRAAGNARDVVAGAASLQVPELSDWQRRILARAVRFVGYPYIWGGSSERRQAPFGKDVPGGFDCSGFVWRVYKLEPFADAPELAETLQGRTTYAMSAEVSAAERIGIDAIEPGDVLFFGDKGPRSKPSQVGHMGLYLGNGRMIHSSSRGTTILPLAGWYSDRFAWARRPLAEAGLEPS